MIFIKPLILAISFLILCNLANNDLDNNAFAGTEKEPPLVNDENLQVTQLVDELNFPTDIDFLSENDILVIEKNTGQVKRILNGEILPEPVLDVNVASENELGLLGIAILNTKGLVNSDDIATTTITNNNYVNLKEEGILDNDEDIQVFLFYTETDVLIIAKY